MEQQPGVIALKNAIQSPPVSFTRAVPYSNLKNKTILITGGASGIGSAVASHLAQNGANIIIGDINEAQGSSLVAQLRESSKNANHHFFQVDVSDWDSQVAFFREAASHSSHRGIDCVIANAGINIAPESVVFEVDIPRYSTIENPPKPSFKTLRVDLDGVLYTTTLALSYLSDNPGSKKCSLETSAANRDRHLLLISSVAGVLPMPASSIYGAAKHGIVGLFRSIRITAPILHGVRVNMICPQYVVTPIHGATGTGTLLGVSKTRMEDMTEAAARLIADQAIIGRALVVGTRGSAEQVEAVGLGAVADRHIKGSIWDIHGHDFEQSDKLLRRVVALLNLATGVRGWTGFLSDIMKWMLETIVGIWKSFLRLLGL
jgi:NAD(P)-dependent dehydrogenase (short-subunit alcohol dehydrogenase family)